MTHCIFLHGALGSGTQLQAFADMLPDGFTKHVYTFSGHGGKPLNSETFSIAGFADEVLAYMDAQGLDKASFFGYSMGGYVAMYIAQQYTERVEKICTLATKWYWDNDTAAREAAMLNPESIEEKVPAFAAVLMELHAPRDWKILMQHTADLLLAMGAHPPVSLKDLNNIEVPVMLCLGDGDKMVPASETEEVRGLLNHADLQIISQTKHPIDRANLPELAKVVQGFLSDTAESR